MKIQTTRRLLFSLVLSGMGFAAIAPGFSANPAQSLKLNQQGYGHAPHPPLGDTQNLKLSQQGYGHTPHPPLGDTQSLKLSQQGYGQRYGSELQASDKYSPGASLL